MNEREDKVILIVEDDPKNMKLVRDLLQKVGYATIEAADGETGLRLAKENKPNLILLDVQLPDMNGLEVVQALKSDHTTKSIPVIVLTSYVMPGDEEKARQAGCDGYIGKPLEIPEFLKMVAEYLP